MVASAASHSSRTRSRVIVRTDGRLNQANHIRYHHQIEHTNQHTSATATAAAAAAAAAATAAAARAFSGSEQPACAKLKIWPFAEAEPSRLLESSTPLLTLPNVVLCSEMGTHFSPCGRYLVAAVVCRTPLEADSVLPDYMDEGLGEGDNDSECYESGKITYELRVLSVEPATFGQVIVAKNLSAAHCLTSIQFSPTSQHVLVAYGRRHMALLDSVVADAGTITPMHTVMEVYSLPDLDLVETFASAEDEVNVAIFHPVPGEGIAYGTKEGRLQRIYRLAEESVSQ